MITLAPLRPEHVGHFYRWIRDPEVIEYSLSAFQTMTTEAQIDDWFARTLRDDSSLNLGVFRQGTNELLGYAGISGISRLNQSGEYFIFLGERACWGQGVGTEVTKQVLVLGFTQLHLNRIMLTVSEPNVGGVRAYEKAGFRVEGRLREACLRNGQFHDKLIMSVLKAEW
ncbi:Protein N-acetyltransferase, RimJ/RimL family [Hymenobacter gelipurpurascens]|uniref:Protein N-acetyltransferase, RimJ/RimL family n=1 Tax=Hymenobacter gelipurpurascens TaxID=89968 RepID=A0A212UCH5_9BACT|nr:GNAT family protein [Hymenobacter gelipurpurascens]SNC75955.1 Protein N-acetyltransferase, RimJ/RimL family [Hymenobacter gelipurpurascens]